jgi:nitrite reductase/ring-hydroxylating ferredoxin subunit
MNEPRNLNEEGAPLAARRTVLRGAAGLVGLAAVAPLSAGVAHAAEKAPTESDAAAGAPLCKTSDIPVKGGKIFDKQKVVVTQPTKGVFRGFSAICTHQNCILADCDGGTINCGCHASKFDLNDGHVLTPPATKPLPPVKITVKGDQISHG